MKSTFLLLLLAGVISVESFLQVFKANLPAIAQRQQSATPLFMAKEDSVSRRRKRRQELLKKNEKQVQQPKNVVQSEKVTEIASDPVAPTSKYVMNEDGSNNLEDMFGLGNEQLKELLEQELPVPREDLVTGKEVKEENRDKNKVFRLPDLNEFIEEGGESKQQREKRLESEENKSRVDRKNQDDYLKVLQLNPFADADETMFQEEYDIISSIFGSGKLLGIPIPYLQTGHSVLLGTALLAAAVYYPGNPLTEFPLEIREFLRTSVIVTVSINVVLAFQAFGRARSKNLPGTFWAIKTLILGGIAFFEISVAKDPRKLNDPADRKSKSRRQNF